MVTRLVEDKSDRFGLVSLIGKKVLLLCGNYFYCGKLTAVNKTCVELTDAGIVYETGEWSAASYKDFQSMGGGATFVRIQWIEAFREGK